MPGPSGAGNRLAGEPSLYLRQHANNPVDWWPWCDEALDLARSEDRPILLSVGYSACHWCHVMEHESFENAEIADLMNRLFVCIKVDREERPDIDAIYMRALQGMTGRGGWPMTLFLTPQGKPYYAGTYFPPVDRGELPAFSRVLVGVARAYSDERDKIEDSARRISEFLAAAPEPGDRSEADAGELSAAVATLASVMDAEHGGFGTAPKFPGTLSLQLMMAFGGDDEAVHALVRTAFDRMADGGVYDQLGGGFHRYSVDQIWLVPHFEKMLYDQALLAEGYREAWRRYGDPRYREVALDVLDYVLREMTAPQGGFYAAQDADTEGAEGKFFVWQPAEIDEELGAADGALVRGFYGVTDAGNFEGANILSRVRSIEEVADELGSSPAEVRTRLESARERLRRLREKRAKPGRDEKIVADWNGLMIATMARVGALFGREDLVTEAAKAADFVDRTLCADGRLFHFYADGQVRVAGMLDDYACYGRGCLEVFLATGDARYFERAERAARCILEQFADPDGGGFFSTPADAEPLVARPREHHDGATPSGNSVAAELLFRLFQWTGDEAYRAGGAAAVAAYLKEGLRNPHGGSQLLLAAASVPVTVVVVAQEREDKAAVALADAARRHYHPALDVLIVAEGEAGPRPPAAADKTTVGGAATAYVCQGGLCHAPVATVEELTTLLGSIG